MPNIRQTLLIAASPEKVYEAITTSQGLSGWWTPNAQADAQENAIALIPFGDGYKKKMQIESLIPGRFVQWKCIEGDGEWIGTTIIFQLFQTDRNVLAETNPEVRGQIEQIKAQTATMLNFEHNDWTEYSATFAECSYTWAQFLRSLKLLCETGKGKPWPGQHSVQP